ncbi:MAG: hypothetical protein HZA23_06980 [Nitrospirae bacterium]|nr:hypothetical protein [Nitrospirota bacterium]
MKAVKYQTKVEKGGRLRLSKLPIPPGQTVEVIILEQEPQAGDIYAKTSALVKKKGLKRMTLKEIAAIVHESRGLKL